MLIGISGKKQSGKDTVCKIIQLVYTAIYNASFDMQFVSKEHIVSEITEYLKSNRSTDRSVYPEHHAFADKLKLCASIILGEDKDAFEVESEKNSKTRLHITDQEGKLITNRKFLQLFGTEVGRAIDPNLWVKSLLADYREAVFSAEINHIPDWIVTDVRFPNEAEAIKAEGGILIRVNRDTSVVDDHPSETALDNYEDFDIIISNNGSLQDLVDKVYDIALRII